MAHPGQSSAVRGGPGLPTAQVAVRLSRETRPSRRRGMETYRDIDAVGTALRTRDIHEVLVLGAGYAGLPAAKRLARQVRPDEVRVTLVTLSDEFVERPRLHQIAAGRPVPRLRLRDVLAGTGVRLTTARVTELGVRGR